MIHPERLAWARGVIAGSGVTRILDSEWPNGGRPSVLRSEGVLLGLLLNTEAKAPQHLTRALLVLHSLDRDLQLELGVRSVNRHGYESTVTYRQLETAFNNLVGLIDPNPVPKLQRRATPEELAAAYEALQPSAEDAEIFLARQNLVLDSLLEATMGEYQHMTSSHAIDWTNVPAWATGLKSGYESADPTAAWGRRHSTSPGSRDEMFYGFNEHAIVLVEDEDGPEVPYLIRRTNMLAANEFAAEASIEMLKRFARDCGVGDLLADSGYSYAVEWMPNVKAIGFAPTVDLHPNDLATRGTYRGAIVFLGDLYCPSTPEHLFQIGKLPRGATAHEVAVYDAQIALLAKYRFGVRAKALEGSATQRESCPAVLGKCACPLWSDSTMGKSLAKPEIVDTPRSPEDCCTQQSISVPVTIGAKSKQKHQFGSSAHRDSYDRRTAVERAFSAIKDKAGEDVSRGRIRFMGITKVRFMRTISYMACNRRLALAFERRMGSARSQAA